MIENTSVHHAHHLASLRNAVDNNPLDVIKAYKSFAKAGHIFSAYNAGSVDGKHTSNTKSDNGRSAQQRKSSSGASSSTDRNAAAAPIDEIEFSSLDSIQDSVQVATENAEKGGMFSIFARKKKYES